MEFAFYFPLLFSLLAWCVIVFFCALESEPFVDCHVLSLISNNSKAAHDTMYFLSNISTNDFIFSIAARWVSLFCLIRLQVTRPFSGNEEKIPFFHSQNWRHTVNSTPIHSIRGRKMNWKSIIDCSALENAVISPHNLVSLSPKCKHGNIC